MILDLTLKLTKHQAITQQPLKKQKYSGANVLLYTVMCRSQLNICMLRLSNASSEVVFIAFCNCLSQVRCMLQELADR